MVKKRATSRKPTRKAAKTAKKKKTTSRPASSRGDRSRLDLKPLQDHIRRRIKELEEGTAPAAALRAAESDEETIARLRNALDTLADICHPAMDIPI